jgi:site-specific recombinase XerD
MTQPTNQLTFESALDRFTQSLAGKNRRESTIRAYTTDLSQFIRWLHETNDIITSPEQVERADITDYLTALSQRQLTGVSRARKLAAIREYFRFLFDHEFIPKSPAQGVDTPKVEKNGKTHLRPEEYMKLLSLAGENPRDYAIFQVFLQTGVRVSELVKLRVSDIDLTGLTLHVSLSKGLVSRDIALAKKAGLAIRNWLAVRPDTDDDHLFLNRDGQPFSDRGIEKLVTRYCKRAGITKKVTPHSLRHTFSTMKAERGVSPYQLQQWLGHSSLNTTQIYIHLGRQNARKAMEATTL